MITLLIVLVSLTAYFGVGYHAAVWNIPKASLRIEEKISFDKYPKAYVEQAQDKARKREFYTMFFLWIVRLLPSLISSKKFISVDALINKHDPAITMRKIEALESEETFYEKKKPVLSEHQKRLNLWKELYPRGYNRVTQFHNDEQFVKNIISIWHPGANFYDE